jgi:predicted metal-binding membrane protein
MTTVAARQSDRVRTDPIAGLTAMRSQLGVVAVLFGVAAVAWWSTADRMTGMDAGPGTGLGAFGWFTGVWAAMMAAMMLPSFAPAVALYAQLSRGPGRVLWLLFACGYLLVWSAAGVVAYGLFELGKSLLAGGLAWHSGGRLAAAGVLGLAAAYQLTPMKGACLTKCRRPIRLVDPRSRWGWRDALTSGLRTGGSCVGCSWALMAALFALGVMSLTWMALVAALLAFEKLNPWSRAATATTAFVLVALAVGILAAPHAVPGLVVPGSGSAMHMMKMGG